MSNSSLNNQNQQNSTRRQQQIPGNLQSSQQSLQNNNRSQPLPPQQPQLQIPNPYQSQYSPQPTAQNSFLINNNSSQPLYPQSFAESSSSVNHQQQSMPSYGGSNQIPSNNYYNQNRPTQQQQQFGPNRNNGPSYAYGNQNQNMYGVQAQSSYFQPFPTIGNEAPIYQSAPSHIQPLYISQFMFNPAIELVQQEVPLTEGGNIIVDVKLSSQVLKDARYTDNQEFTHLRYTPVFTIHT